MTGRIVTSCFFAALPPHVTKVSVARGVPRSYPAGYRTYRQLAPGPWFNSVDPATYRTKYLDEILGRLNPVQVVKELSAYNPGGTVALLCWETAYDGRFCHRGLVSEWIYDMLGTKIVEYERPEDGFGKLHPKLPPISDDQKEISERLKIPY